MPRLRKTLCFWRAISAIGALLYCFNSFAGGVVTNLTQSSLNSAMAGGGAVTFTVSGTIYLNSTIVVSTNTILDGTGQNITISGSNAVQIFQVHPSTAFGLTNINLTAGRPVTPGISGGGAISNAGILNLSGCTFFANLVQGPTNNFTPGGAPYAAYGGAIFNSGSLQASNCFFLTNTAAGLGWGTPVALNGGYGSGGAIFNTGTLRAQNVVFAGNSAFGGANMSQGNPGAGNAGAIANAGTAIFVSCSFLDNTAVGGAALEQGALNYVAVSGDATGGCMSDSGTAVINACLFSNNVCTGGSDGTVIPIGSAGVDGGFALGGAIICSGTLACSNSTFVSNLALGGSGGTGGAPNLNNQPAPGGNGGAGGNSSGGAVALFGGSASFVNVTFVNNVTSGGKGGMGGTGSENYLGGTGGNGGEGGNGGNGSGGAFCISGGTLLASNLTIASNSASAGGAGDGGSGGRPTEGAAGANGIAGASGSQMGDSVDNLSGFVLVQNTIICADSGTDTSVSGKIVDAGYNVDASLDSAFTNSSSRKGIDPLLGPLANNGGPTPTMALLAGSPAIDAANPTNFPSTDQRGVTRPYGLGPDIGAFEYVPPPTISGVVFGLLPGDQATVLSGGQSVITTNGGSYSISTASGAITISNANYAFVPPSQNVSWTTNQTGVNFQAFRMKALTLVGSSAGTMGLVFAGTNGQVFNIQTSTNLLTWYSLSTNTIGLVGVVTNTVPIAADNGKYFRVVSP